MSAILAAIAAAPAFWAWATIGATAAVWLAYACERAPLMPGDSSRLDALDAPRCHYCDRAPGEGHGLVDVNGSPHRCPVTVWGRR